MRTGTVAWLALGGLLVLTDGCTATSAGSPPPGGEAGAATGSPCAGPNDCAAPNVCAWPLDGGCNARGVCVSVENNFLCDGSSDQVLCGCDGALVHLSCLYGPGHVSTPVPYPLPTSTAACVEGPPDTGAGDGAGD